MGYAVHESENTADNLNGQIDCLFVLLHRIEGEDVRTEDARHIEHAIDKFVADVMRRLDEEERELKNSHSPDLVTHLARHRFFASQVSLLKIAFHSGQLTLAKSVVAFLRTWLNYHISKEVPGYRVSVRSV